MRAPSARVLKNRCTIYPYVAGQDLDAGNDPTKNYPAASATALPCSHQCKTSEYMDENGRVSTVNNWLVTFAWADVAGLGLKTRDRLDLLMADGVTVMQSIYVNGILDRAARGSAAKVTCREVL